MSDSSITLTFDIAEDELQIYLAETDEHLQTLDDGFVQLEGEGDDPELLQAIFRAAHTLKGSAGMIGHKRMAELTHALEAVLDSLRKRTLAVSTLLTDACLEALDALKLLRNEVMDGQVSPVDVAGIVKQLLVLQQGGSQPKQGLLTSDTQLLPVVKVIAPASQNWDPPVTKPASHKAGNGKKPPQSKAKPMANRKSGKSGSRVKAGKARRLPAGVVKPTGEVVAIAADIARDSMASAARAFQVLLALQSFGEIVEIQPSQAVIETAVPVRTVTAQVVTSQSHEAIRAALANISELERLVIGDQEIKLTHDAPEPAGGLDSPAPSRLGEFLLEGGYITEAQRDAALEKQTGDSGPAHLLGPTLVQMGAISQETLDKAIAHQQKLRVAQSITSQRARGRPAEKTVRTSVERLDSLMNLVGELITDRNRLNQIRGDHERRLKGDDQIENLAQTVVHIGRITDQLQEEVMRIRMLPIASVFNKFPRLVRDLARKANKQAELIVRGEETELDRTVIEEISDPLIHLLRNAVDHGLETPQERVAADKPERGAVLLTARHEESRIILTVEDDGRGIDTDRLKAKAIQRGVITEAEASTMSQEQAVDLIFAPGLSTAKVVTDVSGRGVGMDIVRANIERLNGTVVVETWPEKGTRMQIVLPLTLAIVPALLVRVGQGTYAIPLSAVMEIMHVPALEIHTVNGHPVTQLRQRVLPLAWLNETLGMRRKDARVTNTHEYVVAVRWAKMEMGLIVDVLIGEQELVIKSLGALVGDTPGISGAAILGDGQVALIVDVPGLLKLAGATR